MASAAAAVEYWGYLVAPDKSPKPILESLLLGIAHYISKHIAPWEFRSLTPAKLAQFYRLVGGNYDTLFIDSPPASLSFIYKSLGCYHSLQQEKDPFVAPYIPALTPQGFVRWQTVQLLLCPEEHVPYLQEAVKRFEIINNGPGGPFPKILPAECLPRTPDLELTKWHERVGERLRIESEAQTTPRSAGRPPDIESLTDSTEGHSAADAADYFSPVSPRKPGFPNVVPISPSQRRPHLARDPTGGPHFRRHSSIDTRSPDYADGPTPTTNRPYPHRPARRFQRASVESASPSSPSSPSLSPPPRRRDAPTIRGPGSAERSPRSYSVARNPYSPGSTSPLRDELGRRHSANLLYDGRRDSISQRDRDINSRISATLSPQFFTAQNGQQGRPISQPGPSPTGQSMPPPPAPGNQSVTSPQGSFARGQLRNTVNHGSRESTWRNKLNAYVNMTGSNKGRNNNETRDRERDRPREREPVIEGVRFVDGVGGYERERDRRRDFPEREWESEREGRRRERRERRRSGGSGGSVGYDRDRR